MAGKGGAAAKRKPKRASAPKGAKRAAAGPAGGRVRCPLCGRQVSFEGAEAPAALNRHFETDCTWRHTSRSPARSAKRR